MAVFDYSAARPGGAALRGSQGVVRYAGALTNSFNISAAEVADLRAHNVPIGIVVEQQINAIIGGRSKGQDLAHAALNNTRQVGLPDGLVYVACDFDVTNGGPTSPGSPGDQNMQKVRDTLTGAADVLGWQNVGFYGSYFAVDWLVSHGVPVTAFWSTEAWSMGRGAHPRAALYQRAGAPAGTPAGCDWNDVHGDWHPRGGGGSTPPPAPTNAPGWDRFDGYPTLKLGSTNANSNGKVSGLQHALNALGNNLVEDGNYGPATESIVRVFQTHRGLTADGVFGPISWHYLGVAVQGKV